MKNTIKGIEFQTHIISRQPLKMGPNYNKVSKTLVHPLNDKTILNNPMLKKKMRHQYSAQDEYNVQHEYISEYGLQEYSVQDEHSLQK